MIFSLLIFALEGESGDIYEEIPRILGYAGSVVSCFNIFMTNLIIISKCVSRECRGFLFGIVCAAGSLGAYMSLTLGQLIHDKVNYETLFALEMVLCVFFIVLYFCLGGSK
jgi:nitrate/nitrite transporter NarK